MTEGPMSTPRRPAPRSIGTPIIFTFFTMTTDLCVAARWRHLSPLFSHYGWGDGKKGLGPPGLALGHQHRIVWKEVYQPWTVSDVPSISRRIVSSSSSRSAGLTM